ncbi:MAG: IS21 family transposase [Methanococcoides sp.]|nr:IS21 family transposase [Methanococcoides sp.]
MITPAYRATILQMKEKGIGIHEISRTLKVARNTVRDVIKNGAKVPHVKESQYNDHLPVVKDLFRECKGNLVRVKEELESRHEILIPYQTLTWLVRKEEIRKPKKKRSGRYVFEPGEEMQHDTSPHPIILGGKKVLLQCASLVMAYSRKLYMQYYPCFTRFECRVFLAKAFAYMDGTAGKCIIDNTHVILASGIGPDAIITPEMEHFGRIYNTRFEAHWLNDPNRKARVERPFHYIENNFIPGRTFADWDDLNKQAEEWCTNVSNPKHKRSLVMSPDAANIMEQPYLSLLPSVAPPVYKSFYRIVNIEGYIQLDTNRYSVPQKLVGETLEVQKHWDKVIIYDKHNKITEHKRVLDKRNRKRTLPGHHPPLSRKPSINEPPKEEVLLSGKNKILDIYIGNLKAVSKGRGVLNLRRLLLLQRSYPEEPFIAGIETAQKYGLYDLARVEKIILKNVAGDFFEL